MNEFNNQLEVNDKKTVKREILEWVVSILVAVVLALVIRQFVFTVVRVDGESMVPTLHHNDRLIVWRLGYTPQNGDIIVLHQAGHQPYIKRIIANEGQTVDIDFETSTVYVDGVALKEDYIADLTKVRGNVNFPVTVGEDEVFVLGDNRNNSRDSRFSDVACVDYDDILGKAVLRFLPFSDIRVF
ncbi:MAG: signal peptidase I [Clostridia bacterium]|nr:signal peptidase I [Clostridia bacterium]